MLLPYCFVVLGRERVSTGRVLWPCRLFPIGASWCRAAWPQRARKSERSHTFSPSHSPRCIFASPIWARHASCRRRRRLTSQLLAIQITRRKSPPLPPARRATFARTQTGGPSKCCEHDKKAARSTRKAFLLFSRTAQLTGGLVVQPNYGTSSTLAGRRVSH